MNALWPPVTLISVPSAGMSERVDGLSLQRCCEELEGVERRMGKGLLRNKEASRMVSWLDQARRLALELAKRNVWPSLMVPPSALEAWIVRPGAWSMFIDFPKADRDIAEFRRIGSPDARTCADLLASVARARHVIVEVVL